MKKQKSASPAFLVTLQEIQKLIGILKKGCATCGSPFENEIYSCQGCCYKVSLTCENNHNVIWYSSSPVPGKLGATGPVPLLLNHELSAAIQICGLKKAPVIRMLSLLGISGPAKNIMQESTTCLMVVTAKKYDFEMNMVRQDMEAKGNIFF